MALDAQKIAEYRALLTEINRMAQSDLVTLWRSLEHLDRDSLFQSLKAGVPEIAQLYRLTAAETAQVFYEDTQGLQFDPFSAQIAAEVNQQQLEKSLRWAMYAPGITDPLSQIGAMVQKTVVDGSRQYAMAGFKSGGTKWWRAPRPEACAFCRMLGTRAVTEWHEYGSAAAGAIVGEGEHSHPKSQPLGEKFHDHCMCIPVKASEYEIPSYVEEWTDQYYEAVENVSSSRDHRAILAEMRRIGGISH